MQSTGRWPVNAGSVPTVSLVYKGLNLVSELDTVPVESDAARMTLRTLGEELVWEEGLEVDDNLPTEDNTVIIPMEE